MLGPQRVVGFQAVVEAGADAGVLGFETGFLLDEAGQLDDVVDGRALGAMVSARPAVCLSNSA